ncbi:MAG: hypothetical protein V8T87_04700 [Victivallales bacterium]
MLPQWWEAQVLADKSQDKRATMDGLLASPNMPICWRSVSDMLRIKSEFPINLWPNAVQAWHRQFRAELLADRSVSGHDAGYAELPEAISVSRTQDFAVHPRAVLHWDWQKQ